MRLAAVITALVATAVVASPAADETGVVVGVNAVGDDPLWEAVQHLMIASLEQQGISATTSTAATHCLKYNLPRDSKRCLFLTIKMLAYRGVFDVAVPISTTTAGALSAWIKDQGIIDRGDVAPPVHRSCLTTSPPAETLMDLANTEISKHYKLNDSEMNTLFEDAFNQSYSWPTAEFSKTIMFTPEWCSNSSNIECATILTSDTTEMSVIKNVINKFKLFATVIATGNRLPFITDRLSSRRIIFCDFAPEISLVDVPRATYLEPPACDLTNATEISDFRNMIHSTSIAEEDLFDLCPFEMRRMAKFYNSRAPTQDSRATKNLKYFTLDTKELRSLYKMAINSTPQKAAADWFNRNPERTTAWRGPQRREVRVGVLVPKNGPKEAYDGHSLAAAAALADAYLAHADVHFTVETKDDRCSVARSFEYVTNALGSGEYGELSAVAGPACAAPLAAMAALSHILTLPVLAYTPQAPGAGGTALSNQYTDDSWLLLAAGDSRWFAAAAGALLEHFDWRRIAVLSEASTRHMMDTARWKANIILSKEVPDDSVTVNLDLIKQWATSAVEMNARIFYLSVEDGRVARAALCWGGRAAARGAVWLVSAGLPPHWTHPGPGEDCSQEEILKLAEGHLRVGPSWDVAWDTDPKAIEWLKNWRNKCLQMSNAGKSENDVQCEEPSLHSALLYDLMTLWRTSLDHVLQDNLAAADDLHRSDTMKSLLDYTTSLNYTGLTGPFNWSKVDGVMTRNTPIHVTQWINGTITPVATWDNGTFVMDGNIVWQTEDGKVPDDGREKCGLQGLADTLNTGCRTAFIILIAILLLIFASAMIVAAFYCKRRLERQYKAKLRQIGGDFRLLPAKIGGLDKWEIPRSNVVINRRIGLGAFGTVYGGQVLLSEDKPWAPAAVKTLKPGASTEAKLDFLSEAESMKRFDHKNIVRLLGVVTQTEPVCTVMEFMLYGDLKNYLLSRRHLANSLESEAANEVSPRRLTSMALDVARALSYLAESKYVHRDVAARNCLVGNNRTVKLADFGMTRVVIDSDYYRFSRKGMLPVRWMAPESLAVGVFSPASDIWSFGVLLYEIVTFGSLPYQGLSNRDVLVHVKSGKTLELPSGLKPQLEGLMKSCWEQSAKSRPAAREVAAFLAEKPRLLTPVLDVPVDVLSLQNDNDSNGRTQREIAEERWISWAAPHSTATETTYVADIPNTPEEEHNEPFLV